ncbi:MAG TPA: DUF5686 and carboxypeptidase regulatory-like domain-containing protein [Sphingobacteriaceae bacterium]
MRILFFIACLFSGLYVSAQTSVITGKVADPTGNPVPFASVFAQNSTKGTSANEHGEFRLVLPEGKYDIVFRAIGYKQQVKAVDLINDVALDVVLIPEAFSLKDVVISSGGEDPAYSIIRNAIRKRKVHLHEVDEFTAEVYIKGLQRMLEAPKKFLGKDIGKMTDQMGLDSNRQGILYLSESVSQLSFSRPGNYREEMISSKVSGSNRAFSFNRATDLKMNFYENHFTWDGLSNRPLISPVADNALFYYNYILLGTSVENGELVNKIQVIPKRNSDPVFRGSIYIMEDSWRIHSVDLYLTRDAGINFVDRLTVSQQFYPVNGKWMPSSVKFDFTGGLFGFRFGGYYIAVYKNYDLNPQFTKREFAEVLRITREVNKRDTAYWSALRPIPLTEEERNDYHKKQALAVKRESKAYLDSIDKANNKFKVSSFILTGYSLGNRYKKEYYRFGSLLNSVFYNTVEGWGFNYEASYSKQIDSLDNRYLNLIGAIRYGFSNEKIHTSLRGNIPIGKTGLGFGFGSDVVDLNSEGTISQLGNTINSLLYERNYMKLYEKRYARLSLSRRLAGGLQGSVFAEWNNRRSLVNTTDFKWREDSGSDFTSNNPFVPFSDQPLFPDHQAFKIGGRLTYNFSSRYVTYPNGRYYVPSKWPTLGLSYTKAVNALFGSDVGFGLLSADLSKSDIPVGMYGKTSFYLAAGKFLSRNILYYTDFKHFSGNQTLAFEPRSNGFLLLPYYQYSTSQQYAEAHIEHNFSGFILNKLPLVRKLKLQELAAVNYLSTPVLSDYTEVAFGVKHMFGIKAMYAMSFAGGERLQTGFKLAYGF